MNSGNDNMSSENFASLTSVEVFVIHIFTNKIMQIKAMLSFLTTNKSKKLYVENLSLSLIKISYQS